MDEKRTFAVKAAGAVLLGVLLGVMIGVPYDQVLGLSDPLYSVLRPVVSTFAFISLTAAGPAEAGQSFSPSARTSSRQK
jgi:ABC-type nitrate/sulfonate/bicarbonate transport system permease component